MISMSRAARGLGAAALVAAGLASAPAEAQERLRWGIPIAFGSNLTALGDTLPYVAQQLNAASIRSSAASAATRSPMSRSS